MRAIAELVLIVDKFGRSQAYTESFVFEAIQTIEFLIKVAPSSREASKILFQMRLKQIE